MFKILLVEDDALIRDMLARYLTLNGYHIVTASDGARGVLLARQERPDLILMDMGLPILNGWQATHRIKTSEATRMIPVVALTAYALSEDRARCMQVGCDAFESKPVDMERLLQTIRSLLDKSSVAYS